MNCSNSEVDHPVLYNPSVSGTAIDESLDVGVDMSNVEAVISHKYDRKPHDANDKEIEVYWARKQIEIPSLYNASKFRLGGVICPIADKKIVLNVGLTDYKSYVCTNANPQNEESLLREGFLRFGDRHACMSDSLGISSIVLSSDDFVLFMKRSYAVFEAQGMVDFPGGHPEPEELFKKCGKHSNDLSELKGQDVVYEIFHSAIKEIRDEINLPESSLSWPLLIGIIRNKDVGLKPHMSFFTRCSLSKAEIEQCYSLGGPEAEESLNILFVHIQELKSMSKSDWDQKLGNLSPMGRKTLELFMTNLHRAEFHKKSF